MKEYLIKHEGEDFIISKENYNSKGTRPKNRAIVDNETVIFKYQHPDYNCSEACSEKLCYEIAKKINYSCAKIELAEDSQGRLGVLNYLFEGILDRAEHTDALVYLNKEGRARSEFYTLGHIKKILDELDTSLYFQFLKIMIFDALVGEQDRHEENWGIYSCLGNLKISPLYDNGCSLLREFKDIKFAEKYYSKSLDFNTYIRRSKSIIYKENHKSKYKHFELIELLFTQYPDFIRKEIFNLRILTNKEIKKMVCALPKKIMDDQQKSFIICYIIERRDILLNIVEGI